MARESEFVPLNDAELRAVIGPNSRHVALIEDAFDLTPLAPDGGRETVWVHEFLLEDAGGIAALVANMVFNFALLAVLYQVMVPDELKSQGVWVALGKQPGLHLALGIASALSSYLNLGLLWYWLGKTDVYQPKAGWGGYVTRLGLACAAMVAVLLGLLQLMTDFTDMDKWHRIGNLALLVGGGGLTYLLALVAMGFRPRHLREH